MKISVENLKSSLLRGARLLDVRAPIEFSEGHIPEALNIPLLEDSERHDVGLTYKNAGKESAIALGHRLVCGEIKDLRLRKWKEFFKSNPEAILYCFRGGLRSQTVQSWLKAEQIEVPLLDGGYKAARQYFLQSLDSLATHLNLVLISGPTGSGKTHLLKEAHFPSVDLEFLARHKGSAFGAESCPQPPQAQFENDLAVQLLKSSSQTLLLEDESRMIGQRVIPEKLFNRMRESAIIWVDEPLAQRVENIFQDYILTTAIGRGSHSEALALFDRYENSLMAISRKLGGAKTQEIKADLLVARCGFLGKKDLEPNRVWIEKLLIHYYDPLYLGSLARRQPQVLFRGTRKEILSFLESSRDFRLNEAQIAHR